MSRLKEILNSARVLFIGVVAVAVVIGTTLIVMAIAKAGNPLQLEKVDVLANSKDECVVCHRHTTTGIVDQYSHSTMAAAKVTCRDCHEVGKDYPGSVPHQGTYVLPSPTTAMCNKCHKEEVAQYLQSRHSLPAYVAWAGAKDLSPDLLAAYKAIPEGTYSPDQSRNAIAAIEGSDLTRFTCEDCHNIGKPAADGSVGECQKCHLRHTFSLEQARKPETCNACHIGPDHPQWEIYQESPHGIAYMTGGANWNWEADPGSLSVSDFPAPTCAVCHMSGFGRAPTTHDVGDRLTWYLFSPVSVRRPDWNTNLNLMQSVCLECHNKKFVSDFYTAADTATEKVNTLVNQGNDIIKPLQDKGLLTNIPFDDPLKFASFELWHHWGRTTKYGTWMQGPDYAQWHGAYEMISDLVKLQDMVNTKLKEAGAGK